MVVLTEVQSACCQSLLSDGVGAREEGIVEKGLEEGVASNGFSGA